MAIPSQLAYLPVVRGFVEGVCKVAAADSQFTHDFILAVNEAASNVIRHAHRHDPAALLQVQCVILADAIEVRLQDRGDPFNLADFPELDPSELRCGGRGVFLMRALVDVLECVPLKEGGNTLRMVKRRTK
jgi:serine/threonine-protein kinase RsbW